jgi:hypothetical protein
MESLPTAVNWISSGEDIAGAIPALYSETGRKRVVRWSSRKIFAIVELARPQVVPPLHRLRYDGTNGWSIARDGLLNRQSGVMVSTPANKIH